MTTVGTILTKRNIIEQIEKGPSRDIDFEGAHINHDLDLYQSDKCIILTERVFNKIKSLTSEVIDSRVQERGTIFFGRTIGDTIVLDRFESDLKISSGLFESAAVDVTEKNMSEIAVLTEKTEKNTTPYDVVMHFHVHPSYVQYKNKDGNIVIKDINEVSGLYSDQDLFTYGVLQQHHQPESDNKVTYLGGLIAVNYGDMPSLSIVGYSDSNKDFYNFPELYRIENDKVIKINRYNYNAPTAEDIEDDKNIIRVVSAVKVYKERRTKMAII